MLYLGENKYYFENLIHFEKINNAVNKKQDTKCLAVFIIDIVF